MKSNVFAAVAISGMIASGVASAEGAFDASATLGYNFGEAEALGVSQDINTVTLQFDSTIRPYENFEFDFNLDMRNADVDNLPLSGSLVGLEIAPRYTLANGAVIGGFYELTKIRLSAPGGVPSVAEPQIETLGVSLGVGRENWDIEGFVSRTELDPVTLFLPVKIRSMGIKGTYDIHKRMTIGGHAVRSEVSGPVIPDLQALSIGAAFFYDVNDSFSVYGGLSQQWVNEFGIDIELTTPSIGVAYTTPFAGSSKPVTFSLEYAQANLNVSGPIAIPSVDFQEIRVGLSIPLGTKTSARPLNSSAHKIMSGSQDIFSSIINF